MILLLAALWGCAPTGFVERLDSLAQAKNVAALTRFLDGDSTTSPFHVMGTGGAYGVGKFGWHALPLEEPGGKGQLVVFSTPLSSEDTGELVFNSSGGRLHYILETEDLGVKLGRHSFDLRFDIEKKLVSITDDVSLTKSGATPLSLFRFGPAYRVQAISEAGKSVAFHQAGGVVAADLAPGDHLLKFAYQGKVDLPQFAASITEDQASLTNDYWYPMVARQCTAYDSKIHAPKGWIGVAQGELVNHQDTDAESVWQYRMDLPVVYFSLSAGKYRTVSVDSGGRRYTVYSTTMPEEAMRIQVQLFPPIVELYDRVFGKYPFSGFGAVESDKYGGGAMEAYSFATYGSGMLPGEDAHEPSHSWWGGIIPNSYLHSFWNESFANYSEGFFLRNVPIGNEADRQVAFIRHPNVDPAWNTAAVADGGVAVGPAADSLGYGKGGFVLGLLEDEIGLDKMKASLHEWVATHPRGQNAEWSDYEAIVAKVTGRDMKWFFDEWLRRPGFARFTLSGFEYSNGAVTSHIAFIGDPYRFTADVLLRYSDGRSEYKRVSIPAQPSSSLSIPCAEKPVIISFDPWRKLLRKIDANERPLDAAFALGNYKRYATPESGGVLAAGASPIASAPQDFADCLFVSPRANTAALVDLCRKVGVEPMAEGFTYRGTLYLWSKATLVSVVPLEGGKHCAIALGQPQLLPATGDAQIAVTDALGRFLAGATEPKTSGNLTFQP